MQGGCYEIDDETKRSILLVDYRRSGVNDSHKTNYIMISLVVLIHVD